MIGRRPAVLCLALLYGLAPRPGIAAEALQPWDVPTLAQAAEDDPEPAVEAGAKPGWFRRHRFELGWLGLGAAAMLIDGPVKDFVQDDVRSGTTDTIADIVRPFGDSKVLVSMMGAGYLTGLAIDDDKVSSTAFISAQSFFAAALLTEGIKRLAHRDRPNLTGDPYQFHGPGSGSSSKSFVSGHTSHAFSVATVIARQYKDTGWVPPVAYGIATLTGLSRMNDNKHWLSDVALGSLLGYSVGRLVHELNIEWGKKKKDRVSVLPLVDGDRTGIIVSVKF